MAMKGLLLSLSQLISITMSSSTVVGREEELATISRLYASDRSEFLALYGRRRVGKSFLIEEALENKFAFMTVGLYIKVDKEDTEKVESYRQQQLRHFYSSLLEYGLPEEGNSVPTNWLDAMNLLKKLLLSKRSRRKVIFIDELPWLAGPQSSELVSELGFFWNQWARKRKDIFLIVCGSATSWMIDNVIREYGGLYGRTTETIALKPFTLAECERYWEKRGFHLSRYEVALTYMVIGGVPYYMDSFRPDRTMADNINTIYFSKDKARQEFKDVYAGLYSTSDVYIKVIRQLGKNFYCNKNCHIRSAERIKIGDECSLGWNVQINTDDGHSILHDGKAVKPVGSIDIGNHVWLTSNTIVTKNVKISDGCIVAQGAVVAKSISAPKVLVGGVPAKVIKSNIAWSK